MFCPVCGKEVNDDAVICMGCGCAVKKDVANTNAPVAGANKPSVAPLVLGIIGIIAAWLLAIIGHIVSIIGIVLGYKEYKKTGNMTGMVVSIVGEACSVISSIIGVVMATSYMLY